MVDVVTTFDGSAIARPISRDRSCARCRGNTAWLSGPSKQPPPRQTNQRDPSHRTQPADAPSKKGRIPTSDIPKAEKSKRRRHYGRRIPLHLPRQPTSRPTSDATKNPTTSNPHQTNSNPRTQHQLKTKQTRTARGNPSRTELKGW